MRERVYPYVMCTRDDQSNWQWSEQGKKQRTCVTTPVQSVVMKRLLSQSLPARYPLRSCRSISQSRVFIFTTSQTFFTSYKAESGNCKNKNSKRETTKDVVNYKKSFALNVHAGPRKPNLLSPQSRRRVTFISGDRTRRHLRGRVTLTLQRRPRSGDRDPPPTAVRAERRELQSACSNKSGSRSSIRGV